MQQDKEEERFQKRIKELSRKASATYTNYYTDFLNLNEINLVYQMQKELESSFILFGGNDFAERKMVCFCGDENEEPMFPISCIHIFPVNQKFGEELSHRDILGAILNLGLERSKIGDIYVQEKEAYLFCTEKITPFLLENLLRIRHNSICTEYSEQYEKVFTPKVLRINGTVSSIRLDSIIALAFSTSRNSMTSCIESGKVYVNGKQVLSNRYPIKEQDIISVRGLGKARFLEAGQETRKGRIRVVIEKFI